MIFILLWGLVGLIVLPLYMYHRRMTQFGNIPWRAMDTFVTGIVTFLMFLLWPMGLLMIYVIVTNHRSPR